MLFYIKQNLDSALDRNSYNGHVRNCNAEMDEEEVMNVTKRRKRIISSSKPLRLRCSVQNYDWGVHGSDSHVARLCALNSGSAIDSRKPYAEIWIGTHESGPSFASASFDNGGGQPLSLKSWISQDLSVLGDRVVLKWGADLPFLFKVRQIKIRFWAVPGLGFVWLLRKW